MSRKAFLFATLPLRVTATRMRCILAQWKPRSGAIWVVDFLKARLRKRMTRVSSILLGTECVYVSLLRHALFAENEAPGQRRDVRRSRVLVGIRLGHT
jgi:hypothetical protein